MVVDRRVTTQDISWFIDLHKNGQLDLNPPYQRRSVWSAKDRRFFLDTIFNGYPSPTIFLHKKVVDGKTTYSVVDGKQRLETIFKFIDNKITIDKNFGNERLNNKKWRQIKKEGDLARSFWDYVIPVEMTNIVENTLVNEVFDRLNRNSRKLVEQELRHAKYDGWFINFVETESDSHDWEILGVVTTARAKRMRDVQFLSELLLVVIKGQVNGFDQDEITEYTARYEDLADVPESFSEQSIKDLFTNTKKYLLKLEKINNTVTNYTNDYTNFYSLWAFVCLNYTKLPSPKDLAVKYSTFMDEVFKFKDQQYLEKVIRGEEKPDIPDSFKYYSNSIGASTEPPQRQERHKVLTSVLL